MSKEDTSRVEAVVSLINKQTPLTLKQEKFCNYACVERFLKAKGDNVKKAAKQLRLCLSWRESIGIDQLVADEFSAELGEGLAYVAGHDDESRPVMVHSFVGIHYGGGCFDYAKKHTTICYAFRCKFASSLLKVVMAALKITGEYYPGQLHKAFIIDPPSLFSYLWKGVGAFVELSAVTTVVSSWFDVEESADLGAMAKVKRNKDGSCSSSRFAFTVSHHVDSLKPWYLSLSNRSASEVGPTITPLNDRSLSFAAMKQTPRHSAAGMLFIRRGERSRELFMPYIKFYRKPYDEMIYRSKIRPPLGRLISVRRHLSLSQRF
ncbi:hypothetical protein VNO77_41651 [Canavalia gladiata]|uniref:CRAL-TRIO domain-containing protein n=1 Tax=Canavalia gladiata TaxID=3824 RepID=A0AAN9PQD0_CANGL